MEDIGQFMAIWTILGPFGLFYGHLVYFEGIWYILWLFGIFSPVFGMLYQEKSGNPAVVGRLTILGEFPHIE
jgi:hypothetical protein